MKIKEMILLLQKEKNVDKSIIISTITQALEQSLSKKYPFNRIEALYNEDQDQLTILKYKTVVDSEPEMFDEESEILLADAKKLDAEAELGDEISYEEPLDLSQEMGRIGANFAKYIVNDMVKKTTNKQAFKDLSLKKGKIIKGVVQKVDKRGALVLFGSVDTVVPHSALIKFEKLKRQQEYDFYLQDVFLDEKDNLRIHIDRNSAQFIIELIKEEVPEVGDGTVVIESCIREAGIKTKVVVSTDQKVNPVALCIGQRGYKIQKIQSRMGGKERLDIFEYSDDLDKLMSGFLNGVKVKHVFEDEKQIKVTILREDFDKAKGFKDINLKLASVALNKQVTVE